MKRTVIKPRIRHVVFCTLTLALMLVVVGVAQAQQTLMPEAQSVDAEAARRALYSGRVLPVDASRIPEGATPQVFHPLVSDDLRALAGAIAFETDRNGHFDLYEQPADGSGSATALVTGAGQQVTPAWSPDGRQLVYASDQDGDYEIYLRDQGGQVRKLTDNTADDVHPAWSPAGDRIFYATNRFGGYFRIHSMRTDGSNDSVVLAVASNHVMAPSISPNGARMAYMRASVLEPLCQWNWDVWVASIDGANPQRLTNHLAADLYPAWTLDGSEVVLAGCRNFIDFDLYAVNVANGSQRRLNNWFLTNEWGARYAADGAYLAFNSDRDQHIEVYTAPAAGGAASNLTRHPADDLAPGWRGQTGGATYRVAGRVVDAQGGGLAGVTVADNAGRSAVTDAAGNFALENLPPGLHTLTPTKVGFTFGPRYLQATVPPDVSDLEFRGYDKPPIVFVHGIQVLNPDAILHPYNPDEHTFHQIDELLEQRGYNTGFAYLVTSPVYTPSLWDNVSNLTEAIDVIRNRTNQDKVILITHSMGGLVSRAYLESHLYRERNDVLELFTFGSPHHGVPTDVLLILLAKYAPDGLAALCRDFQPAVCEFSIIGMALFNLLHPDRADGVTYRLISGNAPLNEVGGLSLVTAWLTPGPDDGVVPTGSGLGRRLSGVYERKETGEVHGKGSGAHSYFYWSDNPPHHISQSYLQCLEPILADGQATCQGSAAPAAASQETPAVYTPIHHGELLSGGASSHALTVPAGQVLFSSQWTTGTLLMTLVSPTGVVVDPAYAATHPGVVTYETEDGWAAYSFPMAPAGQWQVRLQGVDIPPSGAAYATLAVFESTMRLSGGADQSWYRPGATAVLTASLSAVPQSAGVTADVLLSDGSSTSVNLASQGGGRFLGSYVVQDVPGYAEVRFLAQGTLAGGGSFERSHSALFQISPRTASLNGSYGDTPVPRWPGAAVYSALDVTAGIAVATPGDYSLSADLVDGTGELVAHALAGDTLAVGSSILTLRFDGDDIYQSGRNGPYTVTNVLLVDNAGAALVIEQAYAVHVTRPYAAHDFRVGDLFLPIVVKR